MARLAASGDCCLRAGLEGVWFRIGKSEIRLSCSEIKKCIRTPCATACYRSTRQIRLNATTTYSIDMYYFPENQHQIAAKIVAAGTGVRQAI